MAQETLSPMIKSTSPALSRLSKLSPLKASVRSAPEPTLPDVVDLQSGSPRTARVAAPWRLALALATLGTAFSAAPLQAQIVQAPPRLASAQDSSASRFLQLALGRGEERPRGQALEVIHEYARTDFGQEMVARVLADFDHALAQGWLDASGNLTEEGEFAGYTPFRVVHSQATAQAGLRRIELPEKFAEHFFGSGLRVFPLAILHHEFGHTQFGQPPRPQDVVSDSHGSRLRVEHEMEIVERFENPVRVRSGYGARLNYHNHLGECAGLCQSESLKGTDPHGN